jgi:hypothetical protein
LDYVLEKIVKFGTHQIKTYHGKGLRGDRKKNGLNGIV